MTLLSLSRPTQLRARKPYVSEKQMIDMRLSFRRVWLSPWFSFTIEILKTDKPIFKIREATDLRHRTRNICEKFPFGSPICENAIAIVKALDFPLVVGNFGYTSSR